jgi:Sulfotransferase domain
MFNVMADPTGLGAKWERAYYEKDKQKRRAVLRDALYGFDAVVDFPGCFMLDDLVEMYPNAKVILGIRKSPQVWRRSVNDSIARYTWPSYYLWTLWDASSRYIAFKVPRMLEPLCEARYGRDAGFFTESDAIYDRHNDWVRATVSKEMLLEFSPTEGWEPLCKFLGKGVPATKYPHMNDTAAIQKMAGSLRKRGVMLYAMALLVLTASILAWSRTDVIMGYLRSFSFD